MTPRESTADARIKIHATDGLVNFYLPGYVQSGFAASVKRVGSNIKGRFTDTNDQAIDPFCHRALFVVIIGNTSCLPFR